MSLIRTFQLVLHLSLSSVTFPPNVMLFFETLIPIAQFDVLEGIFGDGEEPYEEIKHSQFEQVDQMRVTLESLWFT